MKQHVRCSHVPTSCEKVGTSKSLICKACSHVPTVPTYLGYYAGGSAPGKSARVLEKGGTGGNGGNSKKLHARSRRHVGVNDSGHVVGEDHHRAKLSDHDVWLIHELRDSGMRYVDIAQKFEVSKTLICYICLGQRRGHTTTGQR